MGGLTLRGSGVKARALRAAFPRTVPILAGFLFLGIAYGVYMHVLGFSFWYPVVMAVVIFGGSLEFVAGTLLLSPFAPVQAFFIALMIQARHLFYGLSMLEKYKGLGAKRIYLIYGLCDETFSIAYTTRLPQDVDHGWFYFFVTLLNQLYWVAGTALGSLVGGLMSFDTLGLSFSGRKPTPAYVRYLGDALPAAIFAMLVVYCLKDVAWLAAPHGLPELLGIAVTAGLYVWRRQFLFSIAGGTVCYMLFIQFVFL